MTSIFRHGSAPAPAPRDATPSLGDVSGVTLITAAAASAASSVVQEILAYRHFLSGVDASPTVTMSVGIQLIGRQLSPASQCSAGSSSSWGTERRALRGSVRPSQGAAWVSSWQWTCAPERSDSHPGDVLAVESAHGKPGGFALLSDMADHADAEKALAGLDTSCNSVAVLRGVASIFSEASALAVLPTSATCATPDRTPANSGAGATCSPQGGQDLATCSARRTQSTEPSGCSEPVSAGGASVGGPARRGSPAAGRGGLAQDRGELRPPDAGGADAGGAHRRPRPSDADGHAGECVAVKVATDCAGCGQRDCFLRTTSVQGKCCALCITRAEVRCMFCGSEFCTACLTKRERKNAQCVRKEEFGRRGSVLDLTLAGTPAPAAPSAVGAGPYEASEGADEAAEEWRAKDVVWNDTRRQPVPERTVLMNPHAVRWECRRLTWYFAYGSNQNVARFNDRVGTWCARAPLALHGYRLAFNKRSVLAGQAYANVEPAEGCTTYGVGYLIPRGKLELLDRYEGVAGGHYVRKRATFSPVPEGKAVSGVLYVATSEMIRGGLLPSEAYLSDCCGAADLLPDEYMAKLRSHRTAPRY